MANGIEVAKAYVTIVPSMQGSQSTITSELTGITNTASETAGEESGKKFGESLAKGLKTTATVVAGAMTAITAGAVATGKAFIDATNSVASYGDQIDKESQKMHISAQAYQEWDFILQHAGSSVEGMKTAMKTLTAQAESGSEAFEALGISQEQIASMSQEDLFGAVITGLQSVEDESERTVLAQSLLGRSATEMTALFNMSAEETADLKNQVHELGGVMSDDAVKASADYADAMQNMQTSFDGLKRNLMSEFLPSVTTTMDGLSKVFSGDKSGIGQIQEGIKGIISDLTALAPEFFSLAQTIIFALLEGFAPMLPQLTTTLFNVLIQAITLLTTMLPSLMPSIISGIQGIFQALFQALPVITSALFELIMSLVTWLSEGDNVTNFINGIIALVTQIVDQFSLLLPVLLPAIVKIISEIAIALTSPENVEMITASVLQIVGAVVVALANCLPEILNQIVGLIGNIGGLFGDFLTVAVPWVVSFITSIVDTVKSWGEAIGSFLSGLINNIKTNITNWLNNLKNGFTNAFNFIRDKVSNITEKVKEVVTNVINKIKELPEKVVSIGKNLVEGLWNGINDRISWVKDKISGMAESITNAIKGVFGVASPSRVFASIGGFLADGLAIGYEDGMKDVQKDMLDASSGLTTSMVAEVSAYATNSGSLAEGGTTYNGGNVTINVYGAQGQNVNELADVIAQKLEQKTRRKGVIYA